MISSRMVFRVLVPLVAVVLVACSAPASPSPAPTPAPKPTATAPSAEPKPSASPTPAASPKPAGQAKYGGTLRYAINTLPGGFDAMRKPAMVTYASQPIFNNLFRFKLDKPNNTDPTNLEPDLAEKWDMSPDGKTFTFYLRKGVKWHDGKPFTADDVVYSLQKMMDKTRSSVVSSFASFDRVDKVDDFTIKIYTKFASPYFLTNLANYGAAPILPKHLANVDWRSPDFVVGTGPFKFKRFTSGVSLEYEKNPDFFRKGYPYLDGIVVNAMMDPNAQISALATNRIDMLDTHTGISGIEQFEALKKQVPEARWRWSPTEIPGFLWLNASYKPLSDVRVRRALAMVTDPAEVAMARYGSIEMGSWDYPVFAKSQALPTAETNKLMGWDKPADQRIAEAKRLMADAGYASGFPLAFLTANAPASLRVVNYVADVYRRNFGIQPTITSNDQAALPPLLNAGQYQLYFAVAITLQGDPDEYMSYFKTGAINNFLKYSNPEADKLWDQQTAAMDPTKRGDLCRQIERLMLADMPVIPLGKHANGTAWWPYVKDAVASSVGPPIDTMETIWFDK